MMMDPDLWGTPPEPDDLDDFERRRTVAHAEADRGHAAQHRAEWTIPQAATHCQVPPTTIQQWIDEYRLYTLTRDGEPRIPRWQISDGHPLPGVAAVLSAGFPGSLTWFTAWATSPHPLLDGTPADQIAAGNIDLIVALIQGMHG